MGGTHDSIARAQELGAQPGSYVILKAQLAAAVAGDGIAESRKAFSGDPARHVDERIVQAIWHEQLLHGDRLATCSGKPVRVIDPGKWNGEAGPDFRTAELEIGGRRLRGDVEIHVLSSGAISSTTTWCSMRFSGVPTVKFTMFCTMAQESSGSNWSHW
jgi:hypothetical protein